MKKLIKTLLTSLLIGIYLSGCSTQTQKEDGAQVAKPQNCHQHSGKWHCHPSAHQHNKPQAKRKPVHTYDKECHKHYGKKHCHKAGHQHDGLDSQHKINRRVGKYRKSITPRYK